MKMRQFTKSKTLGSVIRELEDIADSISSCFDDQPYGHWMIANSWPNSALTTRREHEPEHKLLVNEISYISRIRT